MSLTICGFLDNFLKAKTAFKFKKVGVFENKRFINRKLLIVEK